MATAFKGTMIITHNDGTIESDIFDSADTSLSWATWKAYGGATWYKVKKTGKINDIVISVAAAGTTKYIKVFIDQQDTMIKLNQTSLIHTLAKRTCMDAPIPVLAGQIVLLQMVT